MLRNPGSSLLPLLPLLLLAAGLSHAQRIPEHLVHCYRSNETATNQLPHTLHLFVELLRKIEDANPTSLDMRLLSVNLVHRLRLDGVERAAGIRETEHVTPFRANGIQTSKYQLLLQLISDSATRLPFEQWLTAVEVCQLHRMLSATVEPWERGDEWRTCPLTRDSPQRIAPAWLKRNHVQDPWSAAATVATERVSRCPLEGGVLRSQAYGSWAAGTVVASVAAGLQPQRVAISEMVRPVREFETVIDAAVVADEGDMSVEMVRREAAQESWSESTDAYGRLLSSVETVDNTYAAGLAGDLAEVCVYQGPYVGENVTVGLEGVWNNTLYPRIRHFPYAGAGRWELTDAEILAGIDGLFLSQQIAGWQRKVRRLRLSQVLDMFYSSRGIPVVGIKLLPQPGATPSTTRTNRNYLAKRFSTRDDLTSACDRRNVLQLIDREALQLETWRLAQVLQYRRSGMSVDDAMLRRNCAAAVERFVVYAEQLVGRLPACNRVKEYAARPVVDVTLVLDGARSEYESLELVSYLTEAMDVSNSGSWISIIHGQTGQYMVRRTRSVASVFEQLQNCTGAFPTGLSISLALQRLSLTLVNQTRAERQSAVIGAEAHVVLIASQKQRITQLDFASAQHMIHDSLLQFPDLYFVFVTNAGDQVKELIGPNVPIDSLGPSRRPQEHYKIIETTQLPASAFGKELIAHLNTIPKRIVVPFCRNDSRTEYTGDNGRFAFFEDYISPYQEHSYRIGPEFLRGASTDPVRVTFHVNYGSVSVCMARELSRATMKCHSIGEADVAEFVLDSPCGDGGGGACSAVYFLVTLDQSEIRCSENRCRYPDQVLLIMQHSGLRCERDDRSGAESSLRGWPGMVGVAVVAMAVWTNSIVGGL